MADSQGTFDFEIWKPVVGYEGLYEVSNRGRIRSFWKRKEGRIRKQVPNPVNGRLAVMFINSEKRRRLHYVHRLVLEAFVGPCPEKHETCHHDDDCTNNLLSNLRWGTKRSNAEDCDRNGKTRKGMSHGNSKLTDAKVKEIRRIFEQSGTSQRMLAVQFGVSQSNICRAIHKESWKHI